MVALVKARDDSGLLTEVMVVKVEKMDGGGRNTETEARRLAGVLDVGVRKGEKTRMTL